MNKVFRNFHRLAHVGTEKNLVSGRFSLLFLPMSEQVPDEVVIFAKGSLPQQLQTLVVQKLRLLRIKLSHTMKKTLSFLGVRITAKLSKRGSFLDCSRRQDLPQTLLFEPPLILLSLSRQEFLGTLSAARIYVLGVHVEQSAVWMQSTVDVATSRFVSLQIEIKEVQGRS